MSALDVAITAAERLARSAAIADAGVQACPYPPDATGVRSAARRAWLRKYLKLRPQPPGTVSYDGDDEEPAG